MKYFAYGSNLNVKQMAGRCPGASLKESAWLRGWQYYINGNGYETVWIGSQHWMAENLKVTHYRNGDVITTVFEGEEWNYFNEGVYGIYDKVTVYGKKIGAFHAETRREH